MRGSSSGLMPLLGPGAAERYRHASGRIRGVEPRPVVVAPGEGHRIGNVEFLARTVDTPRFTFGIIDIAPGREVEAHVHDGEDDAFYILEGALTFFFGDEDAEAGPGTFVLAPAGIEHGFR